MQNSPAPKKLIDTPHKKVKPIEDQLGKLSTKNTKSKVSLLSRLRDKSMKSKKIVKETEVSDFTLPLEYKSSNEYPPDKMIDENEDEVMEDEPMIKMTLNRKFTCLAPQEDQELPLDLGLYRNNSTCDQNRQTQDIQLGDNIYLKKLNSKVHPQQHKNDKKKGDSGLRLAQDYEIEQNLRLHNRHHTSYICLNKLQRIFYYVKKIKMTWQEHENYSFFQRLVTEQVQIYNKDPAGHFLRYYQSWVEHQALYLTFQVGQESLDDFNFEHNRLREIEVWDLLRDCCSALQWLSEDQNHSHLNIKPGNIIKCQRKFKLSDPYCSKSVLQLYLQKEGENWNGWPYLAPEIKRYSSLLEGLDLNQADIYSLGLCVIENILGESHFPHQGKQLRMYLRKHLHGYSPALVRTLLGMVSLNPRRRPLASELCQMQSWQDRKKPKSRRFSI